MPHGSLTVAVTRVLTGAEKVLGEHVLAASLGEAVNMLEADDFYRKMFGDTLISYLVMMKQFEIGRYQDSLAEAPMPDGQDVSDWEMREYFEFF